ncbi:autotransporter domain-containing protein [Dyella sp. 2RAB6]|uniref:autotransporter domain-containing protein n=1 Tax=Dyella sp. 2RAB6 TaxID=3232992 RepID=UPI003F902BC2
MEALRGAAAPDRTVMDAWVRPCALTMAVAMALGISGCGGGGGGNGNVKSAPLAPGEINVETGRSIRRDDISGSTNLLKSGAGTLVLTGTNSYTGGTTISQGTLQIGEGSSAGSIKGNVTNNGVLVFNRSDKFTFDGVISGSGSLVQSAGALILTGASTYTGGTTVKGGSVVLTGGATLGTGDIILGDSKSGSSVSLEVGAGSTLPNRIVLQRSGGLFNAGTIGGNVAIGFDGGNAPNIGATIYNQDGGSIRGTVAGVALTGSSTITNSNGSSISSTNGIAIQVTGGRGMIENSGGSTISAATTALYLQYGGGVTNRAGSIIATTGTATGDCAGSGHCAIFVASGDKTPPHDGGVLVLANAGTIIGNVQLVGTAQNSVLLTAGGSIRGDLNIGSNPDAFLTLIGTAGVVQSYAQAVTGRTSFVGGMKVVNGGTWIIDNDDLKPHSLSVGGVGPSQSSLQIGNGGTTGSIGQLDHIAVYSSTLAFNRSDNVTLTKSISSSNAELTQAGTGTLTMAPADHVLNFDRINIDRGTLKIDNTGGLPASGASFTIPALVKNNGALVFDSSLDVISSAQIYGQGSVTQNGSGSLILQAWNYYTGGTTINRGSVKATYALPGDATVNQAGVLEDFPNDISGPFPGVAGHLANAGKVVVHGGDTRVGGNYSQASSGTLAINLGSKLAVIGTAALNGGTLEITGADPGYVSNSHTQILTATGGLTGTFGQLVKDTGVVFTATTINYDANSAWLDTTGLNITTAAAGNGVSYTPSSFAGALRVQGAFTQLDSKIASGSLSSVSSDFVRNAGEFQQAPTLQAAQASLQSLSGQLHAASAAMTFEAIDASSRALADRFDDLLGRNTGYGMWTQNLNVGGGMGRSGYDGVGFQLNGWLVGSDRKIGNSGVAGFAFGQNQGQQRLDQGYDRNRSRSTEGMLYAGWTNGNWYTQGRVGFGHFQQNVNRRLLLGTSLQGVATDYSGNYNVAYGESGLRLNWAGTRITPFANVEYASIDRDGFAEQGAGGFGLRTNAQVLDRWRAGLGLRASRHWNSAGGRAVDFSASLQVRRTLASHGDAFDASFVGLQQWQPLVGIGLSRYSGVFNLGLNTTLSKRTSLRFNYDYEKGQRDQAQTLSTNLFVAF